MAWRSWRTSRPRVTCWWCGPPSALRDTLPETGIRELKLSHNVNVELRMTLKSKLLYMRWAFLRWERRLNSLPNCCNCIVTETLICFEFSLQSALKNYETSKTCYFKGLAWYVPCRMQCVPRLCEAIVSYWCTALHCTHHPETFIF